MLSTAHRYFLEVVRTGSIKDAASRLHVAPSAISRQIAKLEDLTGTPLFLRRPHGMVLTQPGELLADHTRRVMLESEKVLRNIHQMGDRGATTIRIASNEAAAHNILPTVICAYRDRHADVAFQVHVASPLTIIQQLRDNVVDIGIAFSLNAHEGIDVIYENASPVRAIMSPSHPLASRQSLSLQGLKGYPLALTDSGTTVRLMFDSWHATDERSSFDLAFSSNSSTVIRNIVEAGHAVTLSGEITLMDDIASGTLVSIPMTDTIFDARTLQIQTATNARLSPLCEAFLPFLTTALDQAAYRAGSGGMNHPPLYKACGNRT